MAEVDLHVEQSPKLGLTLLTPPTISLDHRGSYVETWNADYGMICPEFVQDDVSTSARNVLRGIHGDSETVKLISCLYGLFYLVIVDWREGSTKGQWEGFYLSDQNRLQVLVPPDYGNGHVVLSDVALFAYKQSTRYDRGRQFTLRWDDPSLKIWWPCTSPILSQRDSEAPKQGKIGFECEKAEHIEEVKR